MADMYRPSLSAGDIPLLVDNLYGLKVNILKELNSYDDQNFLVEVIPGSSQASYVEVTSSQCYVFKIFNSLDSMKPEVIETRNEIIRHANAAGYPTPALIPNVENQYQKLLSLPCSRSPDKLEHYIVCLLNYMPGTILEQVPLTSQLCYEIGWFAGKLDVILQGFPIKENVLKSMSRKWNMTEIPKLREKLHAIRNHEQQRVAEEIIDLFESAVLFSEHKFSKGVIHGDFNDCNILVNYNNSYASRMKHDDDRHPVNIASPGINNLFKNEETHSPDNIQTDLSEKSKDMILNNKTADAQTWHVNGVIDFGDSTQSLYLFEVAIAIVHVMMNMNGIPALDAGSYVLAGYVKHINLTHIEINHLKLCICARFVQSLVLGYFSITQDPDNSYILNHAQRVWPVLKSLWETSNVEVVQHLTEHVTKY